MKTNALVAACGALVWACALAANPSATITGGIGCRLVLPLNLTDSLTGN